MKVTTIDPADDAALREWHAVRAAAQERRGHPEGPDPYEFTAAHARIRPKHDPNQLLLARDDSGEAVGAVELSWWDGPDNRHRLEYDAELAPAVAVSESWTDLLAPAVELAQRLGRTVLGISAYVGSPAAELAVAAGGRPCLTDRHSVLRLSDMDVPTVRSWTAPAPGYSLVSWDGHCPDELVEEWARALGAMNTAPRGDLSLEDIVFTPERVRENERVAAARDATIWTVAARHDATGVLAGFTELAISRWRPHFAEQEDTGVVPAHRGHGLGRLVKAVNALRLVDERPEVEFVETWNADSNTHMLAINVAMGFRARELGEEYEVPVADLAPRLRS